MFMEKSNETASAHKRNYCLKKLIIITSFV